MFEAFHPEDFRASFPFRITPREKLLPHGILVCTTGKLPILLRKYPLLAQRAFDLITDESGQLWKLDSVASLIQLPHLQRYGIFGDPAQLAPYVTKKISTEDTQPSVMTPYLIDVMGVAAPKQTTPSIAKGVAAPKQATPPIAKGVAAPKQATPPSICDPYSDDDDVSSPPSYPQAMNADREGTANTTPKKSSDESLTKSVVKLDIQYRMIPVICEAHASEFYDYPITTARSKINNPDTDGTWFLLLDSPNTVLQGSRRSDWQTTFTDYCAAVAVDTYQYIKGLDLKDENGNPYTFTIVTPYIKSVEALLHEVKDRKISRDDVKIRTYDRVQGDEANVVIIDTSATKCTDLNTNRNRGNVVLSRARDMIILLATNEFIRKVNPLIPRVRFWGRWIAQPKLRYIKDEENARTAVRELKVLIHDIDTNPRNVGDQHKRVGHGVKCARKYAIDRDGVALTDIGTAILLKGSYWLNHWRNKVLYRAFVECETDTIIDDVINLCAKDIPWREK